MSDSWIVTEEMLSAYKDGELTADEAARIERMLAISQEAQQQLGDYERISELLKQSPAVQAPAGTRAAIMRRIEQEALLGQPQPATIAAPAITAPAVSGNGKSFVSNPVAAADPPGRISRRRFRLLRWAYGGLAAAAMIGIAVWSAQSLFPPTPESPDLASSFASTAEPPSEPAEAGAGVPPEYIEVLGSRGMTGPAGAVQRSSPNANQAAIAGLGGRGSVADSIDSPVDINSPVDRRGLADFSGRGRFTDNFEMLRHSDQPELRVGNVIMFLEQHEADVMIVRATVVDVPQAIDTLQGVLTSNSVPIVGSQPAVTGGRPISGKSTGMALYVETSPSQLVSTFAELKRSAVFLDVAPAGVLNETQAEQIAALNADRMPRVPEPADAPAVTSAVPAEPKSLELAESPTSGSSAPPADAFSSPANRPMTAPAPAFPAPRSAPKAMSRSMTRGALRPESVDLRKQESQQSVDPEFATKGAPAEAASPVEKADRSLELQHSPLPSASVANFQTVIRLPGELARLDEGETRANRAMIASQPSRILKSVPATRPGFGGAAASKPPAETESDPPSRESSPARDSQDVRPSRPPGSPEGPAAGMGVTPERRRGIRLVIVLDQTPVMPVEAPRP